MTFQSLSPELVLRYLLVYTDVSINDICNMAQTSPFLNELIKNENSLWEKKFVQRWPRLTKLVEHDGKNWLQRVQHQVGVEKDMNEIVNQMAKECCNDYQLTLEYLLASLSFAEPFEVVEDSLSKKAYKRYPFQSSSFSEVYCAKSCLRYFRSRQGDRDIVDYLKGETKSCLKEALLVSQWGSLTNEFLPQWGEVTVMLNNLLSHISANFRNLSEKQLAQRKLKLNVIVKTFFDEMNFVCDTVAGSDQMDFEQLKNSYFIVKVLRSRKGKAILLAIILQDLLKTYDLPSEILCNDALIYLRVKLNNGNADYEYIDFGNHSFLRNPISLEEISVVEDAVFRKIIDPLHDIPILPMLYLQSDHLKNISKEKLMDFELNFERMMCSWRTDDNGLHATYAMSCLTYDKHIFEARQLITASHEINPLVLSMALSLDSRINLHQLKSVKPIIPKIRDNWINQYAVGMNVFIGRDADGYRAASGVIIDWDSYCAREQLWHENIGKSDLKRPFFSILRDDGTEIYISEEKILGINPWPKQMHHDIIGVHFDSFNGFYYEGNLIKRRNYPEDEGYKNQQFFALIDPYAD